MRECYDGGTHDATMMRKDIGHLSNRFQDLSAPTFCLRPAPITVRHCNRVHVGKCLYQARNLAYVDIRLSTSLSGSAVPAISTCRLLQARINTMATEPAIPCYASGSSLAGRAMHQLAHWNCSKNGKMVYR